MYRAIQCKSALARCALVQGQFTGRLWRNQSIVQRLKSSDSKSNVSSAAAAQVAAHRVTQEPFLNGSSSVYLEEMYNSWLQDPGSVHKSWDAFFKGASKDVLPGAAHVRPPPSGGSVPLPSASASGTVAPSAHREIDDHLSVQAIIRSYQVGVCVCL